MGAWNGRRSRCLIVATLRRSTLVSILFTVFGGPGILLVYLPYWMTGFRIPAGEPAWQKLIAFALICAGLLPLFDSIRRYIFVGRGSLMPGVPTEQLVVTGLNRYTRNPMYVGVLAAILGEAVLFPSYGFALYFAAVCLGFNLFIRLYEEPTLRRRHGAEYESYCQRVGRWWPRAGTQ